MPHGAARVAAHGEVPVRHHHGRVVQHLDLEPIFRIIELGDRSQQAVDEIARILDADLSLAPSQDGEVVVLQDRLKNTYQRR